MRACVRACVHAVCECAGDIANHPKINILIDNEISLNQPKRRCLVVLVHKLHDLALKDTFSWVCSR